MGIRQVADLSTQAATYVAALIQLSEWRGYLKSFLIFQYPVALE